MEQPTYAKSLLIEATPQAVWHALTVPVQMQQWMSETPLEIQTDWQPGNPISISGPWYKTKFANTGTVLAFEPEKLLSYTHLSSLSRLADVPENHATLLFELQPKDGGTLLSFTISGCANEGIYRHVAFYWNVALELLKRYVKE